MFKHTKETTKIFNKVINDYKQIESDRDLDKRKLSYSDYQNLGFTLDMLRYEGNTTTISKNVADYFKNLGCKVELKNVNYIITL